MRDIPLNIFLSFPTPNYVNPDTRGPALIIINAIFLALCTLFVCLRLYTRIVIQRTLGWDDATLVVGYVFAVGLAVDVILANNMFYWYDLVSVHEKVHLNLPYRDRHIYDIPLTAAAGMFCYQQRWVRTKRYRTRKVSNGGQTALHRCGYLYSDGPTNILLSSCRRY
jgi:hypothetical protein